MLQNLKSQEERRLTMPGFYQPKSIPTFLPISLEGGIGDAITSRLTIQTLSLLGFRPIVWSVHSEAMSYFGEPVNHGRVPEFSWHLRLDPLPRFKFSECFSGFSMPEHKKLFDGHQLWLHEHGKLGHTVRTHSDQKWMLADIAAQSGFNTETLPVFSLGLGRHDHLKPLRSEPGEYITIHDGFDPSIPVSGRATKQWDWRQWNEAVALLKKRYPNLRIKQLGTQNGRAIDGVDELLLGKTTITEAFDILARSRLHIDTDSGLAHAATKLGVPCVVMFGPTPKHFYGHPGNENLSSQETCQGNCFWLTKNWMDRCPIGLPTPKCMDDISAERVLESAEKLLRAC